MHWLLKGLLVFLLGTTTALAQQLPDDPVADAPIRLGIIGLAPRIGIRDLGIDTNVFNDFENPKKDYTFTTSPALQLWMRMQRGLLSVEGRADLVYFKQYASERSANIAGTAEYAYRFNRLRPFVALDAVTTRERPGYEIDARARQVQTAFRFGLDSRVASKTSVELAARRERVDYAEGASFEGQPLRRNLNRTLEAMDLTWRQRLTVLTTWLVRASGERERFDFEERRNGDSVRVSTGFELGRFALIRGRAFVGYRRLVAAAGGEVPKFSGVTADVDVSYSAPTQTRLSAAVTRDLDYSFDISNPYYVQTGWTGTLTQRITGKWDIQLQGGRDVLAYAIRAGSPPGGRRDRIDRVGGGIGYQLAQATRVSVDVRSVQRQSEAQDRDHKTLRAGLSVTYGF